MEKIHFVIAIALLNFIIMICSFVLYNESSCTRTSFCVLGETKLKKLILNKLNNNEAEKSILISELCGNKDSSYDSSGVSLGAIIITLSIISAICGVFMGNLLVTIVNFIYCIIALSCASVIINLCNKNSCDKNCNLENDIDSVTKAILNTLMGSMVVFFILIVLFNVTKYEPF